MIIKCIIWQYISNFLRAPLTWIIFLIDISFTCSIICKIIHLVQAYEFLKFLLNSTFKIGFFNILSIKWNIIIMLIIVQNKIFYFQYIETF